MNRAIPDYLLKFSTNLKILLFVTIFSLVLVNAYSPFLQSDLYASMSTMRQFFYSTLTILVGVTILAGSRIAMCSLKKKMELSIAQYCLWLVCEIFFIAILYTVFNIYVLKDARSFTNIFQHALIFIPLLLSVPYIVSYLYLALKDKDIKINDLISSQKKNESNEIDGEEETLVVEPDSTINFIDEKGNLKLSVKQDYVCYLESANNYVYIYYIHKNEPKRFMIRTTLKNLEPMLKPYGFARCHRSYMVNLKKVKIVRNEREGFFIDLDQDGVGDIPISKTYADQIMKLFSAK